MSGPASSAAVVPVAPVAGSIGCPNGRTGTPPGERTPDWFATTTMSPCRFGYDHTIAPQKAATAPSPPARQAEQHLRLIAAIRHDRRRIARTGIRVPEGSRAGATGLGTLDDPPGHIP